MTSCVWTRPRRISSSVPPVWTCRLPRWPRSPNVGGLVRGSIPGGAVGQAERGDGRDPVPRGRPVRRRDLRSEVLSRLPRDELRILTRTAVLEADLGLFVRRRAGLERLGGGVGIARTLEPVRRPVGQQRALVSLPPSLQGAAPRGARACRAGSRAAAARSRGRLERCERTGRGGDRLCSGCRRRRPGVAAGRAVPPPRIPERSFRGRRALAQLAGGAGRSTRTTTTRSFC